jgi:hypothetical protein
LPTVQVIRRQFELDLVARQDPDAVAPHLPRRVAERLVPVLERNLVHAVLEVLEHLAVDFDFLFFLRHLHSRIEEGASLAGGAL